MKRSAWIPLLFVVFGLAGPAAASEVSVHASVHPQRATLGEALTLSIEVKGAQNTPAPSLNIDGFESRYLGPSTQMSISNGQVAASVQHRYTLVPIKPGQFTLGPFAVEHQGRQYHTDPLTVTIAAAQPPPSPSGRPSAPAQQRPQAASGHNTLSLELSVPRQEVYLHERVPVTVKLYIGAARVSDVQYPQFSKDGFSVEPFSEPTQRRQTRGGQTFTVLHFDTEVIPLRSGSLALGPASLQLNVLTRRRGGSPFSDPFFDRFFQSDFFSTFSSERRQLTLRSDSLTLSVQPLPEAGRPDNFSGAVGSFELAVQATPQDLSVGDPIAVQMRINGTGYLADAAAPTFVQVDGFRVYEPLAGKTQGSTKSFEQVLIPQDQTLDAVPAAQFSYFDPQARRYRTLESQPIALVVRPPKTATQKTVVTGHPDAPSVRSRDEQEALGQDIVYIKDEPGSLVPHAKPWYRSLGFLLWQPLPVLLFLGAWWYDQRRRRLRGDSRYARFTVAGKQAQQSLTQAEHHLKQEEYPALYTVLARTLQAYVSAKFDLPPGGIDTQALHERGVSQACLEQIARVEETCEQVRFAQGTTASMRDKSHETLSLVRQIIDQLERTHRQFAVLQFTLCAVCLCWATALAAAVPTTPQTAFFRANTLYTQGQYAEAVEAYEAVLQSGLVSGNLYFNLGNAYFKAGQVGRAILNYERARHFLPSDPDLAANLRFAHSLTGTEVCQPPLWQRLVFPLAQRVATDQLVWLTCVTYTLLFAILAVYRLWPRRPRWLRSVGWGVAASLVVLTLSLVQQLRTSEWQRHAVVLKQEDTPVRFEPAASGTVHFSVTQGTRVQVFDVREDWWQVARCDGRRGWVEKDALEEL